MTHPCLLRERSLKSLVAALLLASACGRGTPAAPATPTITAATSATQAATATVSPTKAAGPIAVIVMENHSYEQIIGNAYAPYINELSRRYALATNYSAVAHPSLPNYLALLGGDTFGVTNDCTACYVHTQDLASEMTDAHVTWKGFMEGVPAPCFQGASSGRYAKKHDPFMYFDDIRTNPTACSNVVPFTELEDTHLPDFTWITPDLCDDMHDCSVAAGDAFLRRTVPALLRGLGPHGVAFITFDEGTSNNHVVTIAAGDGVRPGTYAAAYTHYSLLRTIEDHFGLRATGDARSAPSMRAMLK